MAYVNKRITELPERSALNPDDYTVVDGDTGGTAKFKLADMDDDISNLKTIIDEIEEEVVITKTSTPYEEIADYGRYQDGTEYDNYVSSHKLNVDNGNYVEDESHSGWRASEEYYEIPNGAKLFHYLVNQSVTSISTNYLFYASDKTYLGRSTWVNITTKTTLWNNNYGEYVTIPDNAKYFRIWDAAGSAFHSVLMTAEFNTEVDIPHLTMDAELTETDKPAQGKAVGDAIGSLSDVVSGFDDRIDDVEDYVDDLNTEITVTKTIQPYAPVADCGDYGTENVYNSGYKLDVNNGNYVADSTHTNWKTSETYFEIPDGAQLFSYMQNQSKTSISVNYLFYDTNKTYLGRSTYVSVTTKTDTWDDFAGKYVTIPEGAKYVRIWAVDGNFHALMLVQGEKVTVDIPNLNANYDNIKPLQDLKILVFGDSIWGNDRKNNIPQFLSEYSGATVYNGAIGGTRITGDRDQYSAPAYRPFDGVNLINALLTNTWTDQDATVDDVTSYVKTETLPMLKALDVSTIDVVILAYGHNDFTAPKTVAQISEALNTAVSAILTAYPSMRIVVVAPPWRKFNSGAVDGDIWENGNGDTLRDIADGIVNAANAIHITSINMLDELPWREETKTYYLDSDYTHPSTNGNMLYAHVIYGKLRSLY